MQKSLPVPCAVGHYESRVFLLTFFRHLGFAYFGMTIGFLFSPVAGTTKATVKRSFDFLPPLHFLAFSDRLLSGNARNRTCISAEPAQMGQNGNKLRRFVLKTIIFSPCGASHFLLHLKTYMHKDYYWYTSI